MRPRDRGKIQRDVVQRVIQRYVDEAQHAPEGYLETLINDTLYHERRRLERAAGPDARTDLEFYGGIQRRLGRASERAQRQLLERLARRFVGEVVGNFDERVYRFSTRVVPVGMWALLNAVSPQRLLSRNALARGLADHLRVEGEVEHARALADRGTLVVVPTHLSNLDSIVLGYAVYLIGLPPLTYGAGLNLFTNPLLSFFMRNLGAYRVDRKKSSRLYKDVLKEYATCSLEMGYSNLFFPGGTRSRSGAVEQHLKLGLLGSAVRAYVGNLRAGKPQPNLYVIPCTLSYKLVLEAETLIDDHLTETGKSRYIIEDDESTRPKKVYNFLHSLLSLDSRIIVTFSRPLDIFGNTVDAEGVSRDNRGRPLKLPPYVCRGDDPVYDPQRDAQYTRETGEVIRQSFLRDNVVMSTHLVSYGLFTLLKRHNPGLDLYRLLHTGGQLASFPMAELHAEVGRVLALLAPQPETLRLDQLLREGDVQEIVGDALKHFGIYHNRPAALRRGDRVFHEDRNLLLYYSNRLRGYDLGRALRDQGAA